MEYVPVAKLEVLKLATPPRVAHPCVLCKGGIPECDHYRILILIFPSLRLAFE
jgi:hypothetical protein